MGAGSLAQAFSIGIGILKTIIDETTHTILAQTGDIKKKTTDADRVEWWQHIGFVSRPSKPADNGDQAEAVVIRRGGNDTCIASRDLRGQTLGGQLDDGESCVYAAGPDGTAQARILWKKDGSINLYTTDDNTSTGQSILFAVGPTGISGGTPWGAFALNADGFTLTVAGGSGIKFSPSGEVTIIGSKMAVNAGSVALGATASPATPVVWGVAGISGVGSTSVFVSI